MIPERGSLHGADRGRRAGDGPAPGGCRPTDPESGGQLSLLALAQQAVEAAERGQLERVSDAEAGVVVPRDTGRRHAPAVLGVRDGQNRLERMAAYRFVRDLAAFSPRFLVSVLMHPESLADWARSEGFTPALVYNAMSPPGAEHRRRYTDLRDRLALRLGVARRDLDQLLDSERLPTIDKRLEEPPADWPPLR